MRIGLRIFVIGLAWVVFLIQVAWAGRQYNVAVVRHQDFQLFEQAIEGFIQELAELGYQNRIQITENYNAKSDIHGLERKIKSLSRRSDIDLIFSIGTHSTKRLVRLVDHIPIVFTIVGDPERAGIVSNWKSSGKNYTGVETPDYYSKVVRLMRHYIPFERLGMIYLEGSPSHEAGIIQIVALSRILGFEFVRQGFPLRNAKKVPFPREVIRKNIKDCLESVCPQVDVFFVQTSNTFSRNFDLFKAAFSKYRLVSAGDPTNIKKGLIMGIGKDAHYFGAQCAKYAIQILEGASPALLPMDVGGKLSIEVNLKAADMIGYKPPFELLSAADNLYLTLEMDKGDDGQ
ncbi:MAG: ABC transporter substrate-binding protein [Desulfobacteraceae bacterium]|jgi:ABC-type uncharacterized transport system substrate-binding protein